MYYQGVENILITASILESGFKRRLAQFLLKNLKYFDDLKLEYNTFADAIKGDFNITVSAY